MLTGSRAAPRKMRLLPLIAATFFMVSGGPYAIEDIMGGAGFGWAILILLLLPFLWSLPTALMIGELASAIPADGGFYVWVRRAMGPFWGYQEGWLSLSASIFDSEAKPNIVAIQDSKGLNAEDITHALNSPINKEDVPRVVRALTARLNQRAATFERDGTIRYEVAVTLGRFAKDAASAIPVLVVSAGNLAGRPGPVSSPLASVKGQP